MGKSDIQRLKDGLTDLVSEKPTETVSSTGVGEDQMVMPDGTVVTLDAKTKVRRTIERALSEITNNEDSAKQ